MVDVLRVSNILSQILGSATLMTSTDLLERSKRLNCPRDELVLDKSTQSTRPRLSSCTVLSWEPPLWSKLSLIPFPSSCVSWNTLTRHGLNDRIAEIITAKLLADVLAPRVSDPAPISTTIRNTVAVSLSTHGCLEMVLTPCASHSRGRTKSIKTSLQKMKYRQ